MARLSFSRVKSWFGFGEGSVRPASGVGELGGWYRLSDNDGTGWQRNLQTARGGACAAAFASISLTADGLSTMPVSHRRQKNGGAVKVTNSPLAHWLDKPNDYQTGAEFWAAGVRTLLERGNAVGYAIRRNGVIVSAHWAAHFSVHADPETKAIFYGLTANPVGADVTPQYLIPARDIIHLRVNARASEPLVGLSPLSHCAFSMATNSTLSAFLQTFLENRATPSYALATDQPLTADQMRQLRKAWDEQTQMIKSGGTPIMGSGLKPLKLGVVEGDALLVETFNMTVEDIARAFRIPKALLGIQETAANAESLINIWLATGLNALITLCEQSVARLFDLPENEFVEFDTNALSRMDGQAEATRINTLTTGGILAIDDARSLFGLPAIPGGYGKMPTMQQQQIPVDLLRTLHESAINAKLAPPPAPTPVPPNEPDEPEPVDTDAAKAFCLSLLNLKRGLA
jgi:HK97 family phage portal protein